MGQQILLKFAKLVQPRNYDFETYPPIFDTIRKALYAEAYLRRCRDRFVEMIWKNGFDFVGKNKIAVQYIRMRFREIAKATSKPTYSLFEELTSNLVLYYNSFIIKVRDQKASSGKPIKYFGKLLKPVAGYFIANPVYMSAMIQKDRATGQRTLIGWRYKTSEVDKNILPSDVIHFVMDPESDIVFSIPPSASVIDDIRALRRMEENVEILVFQHAIPFFHYKVGTDAQRGTNDEVADAELKVLNMQAQGMLVTTERHKIEAVGAGRDVLDATKYLEYFKNRIVVGLGQSLSNIGEGAGVNRSTSITMTKSVLDAATRFQNVIESYINDFMIDELLMEGGFDVFNVKNKVEIYLPCIDIDEKLRKEFHTLSLYQGNLLDEDEARREIGREPIVDRSKTYFELVVKPKAIIQALDEPFLASGGSVANREAPSNQHGVKKVGTKARAD